MNLQATFDVLVVEPKALVGILGLVAVLLIASSNAGSLCDCADTIAYLAEASSTGGIASCIIYCAM